MNLYMNKRTDKGFVALLPAIIISIMLILSLQSLSLSNLSFLERQEQFGEKVQSSILAKACAAQALSNVLKDSTYKGGEILSMGEFRCSILPRVGNDLNFTVVVKVHNSITTTTAKLDNGQPIIGP